MLRGATEAGHGFSRMVRQFTRCVVASWRSVFDHLQRLDQSERTRFLAVAISLTPLIVFTKWFAVIHGTFVYDDLDILMVVRTMPLAHSLSVMHGDVLLPLFRIFFSGMYALFGSNELYWNLYFLLLTVAVHLTALGVLVALGANLVVAALFYLTMISARVWSYTAVGYYSMSMYPQIGLLGLIGVLAIIRWRSGGSANYKWLALGVSAAAPFIHPSGAYVPAMLVAFAFLYQLGQPGGSWSPLRMFDPEFRWFTIGIAISVAVFTMFFAIEVRGGQFLSMAHSPLSAYSVFRSMFFLVSQGMAVELFKPFIDRLLRHSDAATHGLAAFAFLLAFIASALWVDVKQRWTFLALLGSSLIIVTVVSLGRRLASIDEVVSSAGKYNSFAYLWFALAMFYLAASLVSRIPSRWRQASGVIAVAIVGVLFFRYAREDNRYLAEATLRRQLMDSLVATFANYAAKIVPSPMHIPTLDGVFIFPQHERLYKYNLAHYRPFFQGFNDRLTLLRNTAMQTWGMEGTQTVLSLRRATDPEFVRALETDHDLQSLYLGSVDLVPLPKAQLDGEPMHLDAVRVSNSTSLFVNDDAVSFSTAGGASIMLFPENWDPEQAHILTLRVSAVPDKPIPGEETQIEVVFEGQLPIPYSANKIAIPKEGGDVSVDLLQLYSYSLNPQVGKLGLGFPVAGSYAISGVRLVR
jgi:hypothetical protein